MERATDSRRFGDARAINDDPTSVIDRRTVMEGIPMGNVNKCFQETPRLNNYLAPLVGGRSMEAGMKMFEAPAIRH
jgi:hypothetical protein